MLSKEDKLKYGEMLRQQMKQKQERKKQQSVEKRGGLRKSPTDGHIFVEKQNTTAAEQKQALQRKLQTQDYMPFGRPGGGAPSKPKNNDTAAYGRQRTEIPPHNPNQFNPPYGQKFNHGAQNQQGNRLYIDNFPETQHYGNANSGRMHAQQNEHFAQYQQSQKQPMNLLPSQPVYENSNYTGYPPNNLDHYGGYQPSIPSYMGQYYSNNQGMNGIQMQHPQQQETYTQQKRQSQQYPPQASYANVKQQHPHREQQNPQQQPYANPRQQAVDMYQRQLQEAAMRGEVGAGNRQRTMENDEMMDVFKKGGRNLLKLQNQTAQEINVKQKQKFEMQKYLKLQMEEAERKKRQEKERLKQQQLQQERKNKQYLDMQNQKIKDDQKKQRQKKQKLQQQNQRNLSIKKQQQQQARRAQEERDKPKPPPVQVQHQPKQVFTKKEQRQQPQEDSESISSNSAYIEQAFNTDVSKQFFRRERQKDPEKIQQDRKIEIFTGQLQKMRDQINNQGVMFEKQLTKVKIEASRAMEQKRRADMQIESLKHQLKRKMEEDNQKLFQALNRNSKDNYDSPPQSFKKKAYLQKHTNQNDQYQQHHKPPLKPKKQQKLVSKVYQPPSHLEDTNNDFGNGLQSLVGDSKKIPLNLQNNPDMSMSQLSDFARETGFFKAKSPQSPKRQQQQYSKAIRQSIAEEEDQKLHSRGESRKSRSRNNNSGHYDDQKDELDRLVQSRQKSRGGWGEMSSVNSDITKEIEQLLKKKGSQGYEHQRPSSNRKLESAGKRSLTDNYNHGIVYDGPSLGTLNSNGTFDLDRIQNRNYNRLKQLRNLGVETINTNGDQDLNRLDVLLNKYNN